MSYFDDAVRDISEASIASISEQDEASRLRRQGVRVVRHRGRYWQALRPGFYQPIHLLAEMTSDEATCPKLSSWGFRAALSEAARGQADGSINLHILSNLEDYPAQLSSNRRYQLRKCQKRAKIVEITDRAFLRTHGYNVVSASLGRTRHMQVPSQADFEKSLDQSDGTLFLAGFIGDELCGYSTNSAVDGVAYCGSLFSTNEGLKAFIVAGLYAAFVDICQRSGIRKIVHGLHAREDENLCVFKNSMRFPMCKIPARVSINPIASQALRWLKPHVHYRLTGRG